MANILYNITAARTITLDKAETVGILNIGAIVGTNATTYAFTLSGANTLTLNNNGNPAQINATPTSTGDTISSALSLPATS